MPKSIPEGLTQQHVLSALADLDVGISHPFGSPTGYELLHDGKRYAPKAVIGLAFKHLNGQMLAHGEFSGGEAPGQANFVLRDLGFDVVAKAGGAKSGFITSRGFALPTDSGEMGENLWFNMWQRRLWPYKELDEGDTLYWYDTKEQAIVWRSRVAQVERFEYANKNEVRKKFQVSFGLDDLNDPYFDKAKDQGYCLAYKVDSLVRLDVPKPADFLVFYCGLQKWDSASGWRNDCRPALYLAGYFEVVIAGMAGDFDKKLLKSEFGKNFHVRYPSVFEQKKDDLVLVKGGSGSRLFDKARQISVEGKDRAGKPLKVLSPAMQKVFGEFGGHVSIQRSPPRWVEPAFVEKAIRFVTGLE